MSVGWTQRTVAQRSKSSQASVSRLEAGDARLSLILVSRIVGALGMDLSVRVFPGAGIGLRDSGQLALAELLRAQAHPSWRIGFEVPIGNGSRQAADMVLTGASTALHLELESRLVDFQAQLRGGQLKRDGLQQRFRTHVAFVLALRDTETNRAAVRANKAMIGAALPATASDVWRAIRSGVPLVADGLLWIRPAVPQRSNSLVDVMPREPSKTRHGIHR